MTHVRMRRARFAVAFLLIVLGAEQASAFPGPHTDWTAPWIGVIGDCKPNTWTCFRTSVDLEESLDSTFVRVSCDSKYWLWVNGELVVFEGQLKRGPTPSDTYFDRLDVGPHLRQGRNTFAILVWHFGRHGFSHNNSGKSGLLVQSESKSLPLHTGEHWRARVHPAFGTTDPPLDNVRQPESNLRFDARHDIGDWQSPEYDDSGWGPPTVYGVAPVAPWNQLYERPIPLWKDSGLREYTSAPPLPHQGDGGVIVAKLPYNAQVTPYLKVRARGGEVIKVATDVFERYGQLRQVGTHWHEYVCRPGEQEFEFPAWINGHEVRYTVPAGVEVVDLKHRETGYDTDFVGSFECDDARLNQLWSEAARTLYVTMRDTYMDCPDRERAQWWGDAVNELGEAAYALDPHRAPLLTRKAIYELARWQRADGTLYSPVPSGLRNPSIKDPIDGSWDQELPAQMLASVGWYGFWTYYWNTGDRQTVVEAYPAVKRYLSLWELDPDGLVAHRPGGWDWSDWGQNIDVRVLDNCWYELALRGAIELARLAEDKEAIAQFENRRDSLRRNFNRVLWNGHEYRSPGYEGATDDRAQAMAVIARFAGPEQRTGVVEVLRRERHASPYMEKYVLEALMQLGEPDLAIDRMRGRYAAMLDDDVTTLWELFDPISIEGFGDLGRGTYNHAWSGGPLTVLSQYVAGVAPTAPAFAEYRVRPMIGNLRSVLSVTPTRFGDIRVDIRRSDESIYRLLLSSPAGTVARVELPASKGADIAIDGPDAGKVEQLGFQGNRRAFLVPPGEWTFQLVTNDSDAQQP
jgi:hypothetical protein